MFEGDSNENINSWAVAQHGMLAAISAARLNIIALSGEEALEDGGVLGIHG